MKKINLLLSLFVIVSSACNDIAKQVEVKEKKVERIPTDVVNNPITAISEVKKEGLPILTFAKLRYNFGEVIQGKSVSHSFTFTNTGEGDLLISNAKGSCGCTVPKWPKKPISPGEKGEINITFNSNGREGKQQKTVTLVTNTIPNTTVLTINGNVIVPAKKTKQ